MAIIDDARIGAGLSNSEPGSVSSSTSGSVGTGNVAARGDHSHDLGAHDHSDAAGGGTVAITDLTLAGSTANYFCMATAADAFAFQSGDEYIQDLVGAMFTSNTETGISIDYQDDDGTIDAVVSTEWVQDLVGTMIGGGSAQTNISVTYDDTNGELDFDVQASGSDTYILFNDGGTAIGAESNFTFDKSTETVTLSGPGTFALTGRAYGNIASLSDGASIAVDMSTGQNFTVTLGGNRAMANPSNAVAGQSGVFIIKQDGTGSRTLSWGNQYYFPGGTAPTLTTSASAIDIVPYFCESSSVIHCGAGLLAMAASA